MSKLNCDIGRVKHDIKIVEREIIHARTMGYKQLEDFHQNRLDALKHELSLLETEKWKSQQVWGAKLHKAITPKINHKKVIVSNINHDVNNNDPMKEYRKQMLFGDKLTLAGAIMTFNPILIGAALLMYHLDKKADK